jgi:electron transport protein HydN
MPVQCKHCENSPCRAVCKQGAINKINNQIIVDEAKCIGCKDCLVACPFGAVTLLPYYVGGKPITLPGTTDGKDAASKCDLCYTEEEGPACVRACPNKALSLNDIDDRRKAKNIAAAEALAVVNSGAPERRAL